MFKSIVCTYPDFRALPKGLKQMLVVSETHFFGEFETPLQNTDGHDAGSGRGAHAWPLPQKQFSANRYASTGA